MSIPDLPPRCIGVCPLEKMDVDLDAYNIALTRNCDGPKARVITETQSRVEISKGGVAFEYLGRDVGMGEVVCKNTGFIQSVDELTGNNS